MSFRNWFAAGVAFALVAPLVPAQSANVALLDYHATPPANWTTRKASSSMRLAEYITPGVNGGKGAEVIVYFFGPAQGGSVDANLARWKGQFTNPAGGAVYEKITRESTGNIPLTIAEYRGTYARAVGMGSAPEDARPNHTLVAVVAETAKGTLFFQLFGPDASVADQRNAYLAFVRSLK